MKISDDILTAQLYIHSRKLPKWISKHQLTVHKQMEKSFFSYQQEQYIEEEEKKSGSFPSFLSYTQCSVCCMLNDLINWEPLVRKTMVLSLPRSNISTKLSDLPDSDFCPIHIVTFTLTSIMATDYIQKGRGQSLLFSFEYNLLTNLISK